MLLRLSAACALRLKELWVAMPSVEELFADPLYLEWSDELTQEFMMDDLGDDDFRLLVQASFRQVRYLN